MGVRGINLGNDEEGLGDKLISLSILRHVEAGADERVAYLNRANAVARQQRRGGDNGTDGEEAEGRHRARRAALDCHVRGRAVPVLTISEKGLQQTHTSSYEYRT